MQSLTDKTDVEGTLGFKGLRDEFKGRQFSPAFVLQSTDSQASLKTERDVAHHVRQLLLHELVRRKRPVELPSLQSVRPGDSQACLRGAERAPGDAVTSVVQTTERTLLPSLSIRHTP